MLAVLLRTNPDINAVLLDLVMPEMGGEETFDALRRIRPEIPILLLSGYDKQMVSERFLGRGVTSFLYKPYEPEELIERVRSALQAGSAQCPRPEQRDSDPEPERLGEGCGRSTRSCGALRIAQRCVP